ncbi:MAG: DUF488 domain-containing protein [Opitutaceae bacterium]|nr:DUF488 domain-containing protein [Opitutaceae bacterium]
MSEKNDAKLMKIQIKRIYQPADPQEGQRILVDRLWPRGITQKAAGIIYWAKDIAPSTELRKWYVHDPEKWNEFKERYFAEIDQNPDALTRLLKQLKGPVITFLFSSKEERLNNAAALREYIEKHSS